MQTFGWQRKLDVKMRFLIPLATALLWLPAGPVAAAPYCLTNQVIQPQCIYYDAHQCAMDASRQGGVCSPNPAERRYSQAHGQYCVVSPSGAAVCAYADYQSCAAAAGHNKGTCMQADPRQVAREPNPYSAVNGQ
jgi:hypothetical protein